ncbi:holin [Clostridium grantii]|uniref:Holin, phage phi LC3 family n=1 Tax=Clostridium grantii DSM 8605 TaxID=1121316 RepID=A0A1M5QSX7_9CLOT|nr:holin [Clostridium grantii]SHH17068.1 hypothetical protein SAMN02745207_00273 [Clostridium grantii DSM 8605]
MSRFKNYGLWISVAAFIPLALEAFGLKIVPQNYDEIVNSLLGILVIAGIVNNPDKGTGYLDETTSKDKEKQ